MNRFYQDSIYRTCFWDLFRVLLLFNLEREALAQDCLYDSPTNED